MIKSWAILDAGDGALDRAACAWTDTQANSRKDRENVAALNNFTCTIFASHNAQPNGAHTRLTGNRAMLGRTLGETANL